jgi:hypothetical protein
MKSIKNKFVGEKSNIAVIILGVIPIILGIVILRNHIFTIVYLITTGDDSGTLSGLHGAIAANIIGIIIQSCCIISAIDFIKYYNWARIFLSVYCIFEIFSLIFFIIFSRIFGLGDSPSILFYLETIYSLVFLRFSSYPRIKERFK